jgi:hypothetical protein
MVAPSDTDPGADAPGDPHFVAFDPALHPRGELFVFLTGTGGIPSRASLIVRQAAASGFHAVALSYPNAAREPALCESDPDDACYENLRSEILGGFDVSPQVDVSRSNSIENRLSRLLQLLAEEFPAEGWGNYLDGDAPRWWSIRIAGHSQGAGHAAFIARTYEVARVCLLEGPVDLIGPPEAEERRLAPWVALGATPADRYYGFRHRHSSSPNAEAFRPAWSLFGMDAFGDPVDTDSVTPPYGGSHHLTTDAEAIDDGMPNLTHRSVVADPVTPRSETGRPLFAPVWEYACLS